MSDLKKIRKKLLKSVLGTTLLAVGLVSIQSISAMSSNKKVLNKQGLGNFHLLNVMQNIRDKETLTKYAQINKKCSDTLEMTRINPISVTKKNSNKLFPKLETICLYGSDNYKTSVDEIKDKDKSIIFDYSFGIGELIHYVSFVNGYDKKYSDDLLNRLNKLSIDKQKKIDEQKNLSIALNNLHSDFFNDSEYKYLKNFITCINPDFGEFKELTGIKYTYKIIKTKSKSKRALVYIVVNDGSQLKHQHLIRIINELKKQGVEITIAGRHTFDPTNCENVIFTIRPEKEQKFKISKDSFYGFGNLTVNIVRAAAGYYAFRNCLDSVINIYDSYFWSDVRDALGGSVNTCHNLTLNVHRTNLDHISIWYGSGATTLNIYDDSHLSRDAIGWCCLNGSKVTLNIYGDAKFDDGAVTGAVTLNNYSNVQFDVNTITKSGREM